MSTIGLHAPGANCTWRVIEWKQSKPTKSNRFIGCVGADPKWNSHGFALVRFGTADELKFFGAGGWDDDVDIR